jgi:hypothetical protein
MIEELGYVFAEAGAGGSLRRLAPASVTPMLRANARLMAILFGRREVDPAVPKQRSNNAPTIHPIDQNMAILGRRC